MMENRGCDDDVELFLAQIELADISLNGVNTSSRSRAHAGVGAGKHGGTEIDERCIEIRKNPQNFEREIPRAATDVENGMGIRVGLRHNLGNQIENHRGVDGRGLSGLQIREALDVVVEALADLVNSGLYCAHQPPSIRMSVPVMKPES